MISLARLVGDRCSVELGFDADATMFRATFGSTDDAPPDLVVRWAGDLAVVDTRDGSEEVRDLPRLAALCDAALATP